MKVPANKILAASLLALLAGCSSTPLSMSHVNHFASAAENEEHGKCMSDNALFNNRQLMVTPTAVANAWSYCARQTDLRYPGKNKTKTQTARWQAGSSKNK